MPGFQPFSSVFPEVSHWVRGVVTPGLGNIILSFTEETPGPTNSHVQNEMELQEDITKIWRHTETKYFMYHTYRHLRLQEQTRCQ